VPRTYTEQELEEALVTQLVVGEGRLSRRKAELVVNDWLLPVIKAATWLKGERRLPRNNYAEAWNICHQAQEELEKEIHKLLKLARKGRFADAWTLVYDLDLDEATGKVMSLIKAATKLRGVRELPCLNPLEARDSYYNYKYYAFGDVAKEVQQDMLTPDSNGVSFQPSVDWTEDTPPPGVAKLERSEP